MSEKFRKGNYERLFDEAAAEFGRGNRQTSFIDRRPPGAARHAVFVALCWCVVAPRQPPPRNSSRGCTQRGQSASYSLSETCHARPAESSSIPPFHNGCVGSRERHRVAGGYSFGLFGKSALVTGAAPYARGHISGQVAENARTITRSGFADGVARLSVNIIGNPAMTAREFAASPRQTIVGASVMVTAPTGHYHSSKLINLGTNRWGVRPEIGVSVPKGRWDLDGYVGVWLFSHNPDFYPGGLLRTQEHVVAMQAHISYTLRPRLWLAFDSNWYTGGATQVEDAAPTMASAIRELARRCRCQSENSNR